MQWVRPRTNGRQGPQHVSTQNHVLRHQHSITGRRYITPAPATVVTKWIRLESLANNALAKHRHQQGPPGVATCVHEYKRTVPALENQSLATLLAYMKAQHPKTERNLTRAAVGYFSVQDETATPSTAASSATSPTMYTPAQVNALLTADRRNQK
jgi:hypothetical protein